MAPTVYDVTTWPGATVSAYTDIGLVINQIIADIKSQQTKYDGVSGPIQMALEQEKRVTDEINALFKIARESGDYAAEEFLMWFIKEQVEEVRSMNDLLNVVEKANGNVLMVEDFLSREKIGDEGDDPAAPPAAGGAL